MKSKVLRAFPYAFDGITVLDAKVGDEIDFRDMTDGLAAEGYIEKGSDEPAATTPVSEPIEEPASVVVEEGNPESEPIAASQLPQPEVEVQAPVTKPKRK